VFLISLYNESVSLFKVLVTSIDKNNSCLLKKKKKKYFQLSKLTFAILKSPLDDPEEGSTM